MVFKLNPVTGKLEHIANTTWGDISGIITEQLDLQAELNAKADTVHVHVAANITDFDVEVENNPEVLANTNARHSHANKALLDSYTQTEVDLADAVLKKHTQNSDTILDEGQSSEVTALDLRTHLDDITTNPHEVKTDIHLSWNIAEAKPYIKTRSNIYTVESLFIFRGTTILGTPDNIKAILSIKADAGAVDVRIYDVTNAQIICEITGVLDIAPTLYDMGVLSNLPTGEAVFEIQGRVLNDGKEGYIHSLNIQF